MKLPAKISRPLPARWKNICNASFRRRSSTCRIFLISWSRNSPRLAIVPPPYCDGGNVLIILDAVGVGDFMWKTSVLREIRRVYPTAKIRLVMYPAAAVMAETCPYVDELILNPANSGEVDFLKLFQYNAQFARRRWAAAFRSNIFRPKNTRAFWK